MEVPFTGSKEEWDKQVANLKSTKGTENLEKQLYKRFGLGLTFAYELFFFQFCICIREEIEQGNKISPLPPNWRWESESGTRFFPLHLLLFSSVIIICGQFITCSSIAKRPNKYVSRRVWSLLFCWFMGLFSLKSINVFSLKKEILFPHQPPDLHYH